MELHVPLERLAEAAALIWNRLGNAKVIAVHGGMGAGKTTCIAALCRAKGVRDAVSSPTFSIINEYAYGEHGVLKKLYHLDLYRLQSADEVEAAGVEDCILSGAICFVEWPEQAPHLFDATAAHLFLEPVSSTERLVKLTTPAPFANNNQAR